MDRAVPVRVYLVEARFADGTARGERFAWEAVALDLAADVRRWSAREVTVALRVHARPGARLVLDVTCACDFEVDEDVGDGELDGVCRDLALTAGPALLYPYVREEVSRLTARSRLGALVLPFLRPPLEALDGFAVPRPPPEDGAER